MTEEALYLDIRRPRESEWLLACPECGMERRLPKSHVTAKEARRYECLGTMPRIGSGHTKAIPMEVREGSR